MEIKIPADVLDILKRINDAGFEAYIVGGCVRDFLLGREPADWDITTSASPYEVKALFRRTIDTGLQHGTVTVMMHGEGYEVTTYRIDGEYEDGRHPKEVTFTKNLVEDLKRRDFTINAMAYHPEKGLIDEFDGKSDLKDGIIRAVGCAKDRFGEDALRMMRAIRFAAQLGYDIEPDTFEAIRELAPTLSKVSAERIQVELVKTLVSDHPYDFKLFYETGLTKVFMPEFDKAMAQPQNHPHHCYSVGEHILHAMENIAPVKELRIAMLLHDIAKPDTCSIDEDGITHFRGHPDLSAEMAKDILKRLKFDNATINMVTGLVRYHDRRIESGEKPMRKAVNKIGAQYFPYLFDVKYADTLAQSMYQREEKLSTIESYRKFYKDVMDKHQAVCIKDLAVTGQDLIAAGMTPGKGMGDVLSNMLEDVLEEPSHNNKEYLLSRFVTHMAVFILAILLPLGIIGCGFADETVVSSSSNFVPAIAGNYDSADNAVVVSVDQGAGTITFMTLYIGKQYTLSFDGATTFADKYGTAMSVAQVKPGDVVDVTFMKSRKRLNSLVISSDTFKFTGVTGFMLSSDSRYMSVRGEDYLLNDNLVVVTSDGRAELMDINSVDAISISGKDHTIYSVAVEQGHGYLRLINDSYFVGGWLDVNSNQICQITEDMLIAVPAGTYPVTVSNQGSTGTETITVEEGKEYEFDVSRYQGEAKYGNILFTLDPENARVYIDGEKIDTASVVSLEYGIHQMIAICDGYKTISRYIKVASESANLDIIMERDGSSTSSNVTSDTEESVSGNGVSVNSVYPSAMPSEIIGDSISQNYPVSSDGERIISPENAIVPTAEPSVAASPTVAPSPNGVVSTTGSYKVYIDGPAGVEVYANGNYVGIAPVSFKKEEGNITVTLRRDGYNTRSYTLNIDGDAGDVNYSFSALTPL